MRDDRSSSIDIPEPIVVSTGVTVKEKEKEETASKKRTGRNRQGRKLSGYRSPRAKVGFSGLKEKLASAPVINGVRVPDDETDIVDHRNGRFINNVFVPNSAVPPKLPEYRISFSLDGGPSDELHRNGRSSVVEEIEYTPLDEQDREARSLPFSFNFDSFYAGREHEQDVYDAMALESRTNEVFVDPEDYDISRSSNFEQEQYTFQPEGEPSYHSVPSIGQGTGLIQANDEEFEIQEHTYQMCPGCPTFSIPIPIPKEPEPAPPKSFLDTIHGTITSSLNAEEGLIQDITNKIVTTITPAIDKARKWFTREEVDNNYIDNQDSSLQSFTDRLSSVPGEANLSPLMYATVAAVGLGVATIVSTGLSTIGGRQFPTDAEIVNSEADDRINQVLDFNPSDVLCLPRLYCEKMKSKKEAIDGFINTKKAAVWILDRIYNKDLVYEEGDTSVLNQCHLRECIYSLLS